MPAGKGICLFWININNPLYFLFYYDRYTYHRNCLFSPGNTVFKIWTFNISNKKLIFCGQYIFYEGHFFSKLHLSNTFAKSNLALQLDPPSSIRIMAHPLQLITLKTFSTIKSQTFSNSSSDPIDLAIPKIAFRIFKSILSFWSTLI